MATLLLCVFYWDVQCTRMKWLVCRKNTSLNIWSLNPCWGYPGTGIMAYLAQMSNTGEPMYFYMTGKNAVLENLDRTIMTQVLRNNGATSQIAQKLGSLCSLQTFLVTVLQLIIFIFTNHIQVECFMDFGTSFSKLKIMRTAITCSTKKCDVLVDQCLAHNNAYGDWKISWT